MKNGVRWGKARKKPIEIMYRNPETNGYSTKRSPKVEVEYIDTREGMLVAYPGEDYIILGVEGEVYPIGKEIFKKTYDIVEDLELLQKAAGESKIPEFEGFDIGPQVNGLSIITCLKCDGSLPTITTHIDIMETLTCSTCGFKSKVS